MSSDDLKDKDLHRQFRQSLGAEFNTIEQEARMVLPGIQTLFGFQLVAVFNQAFHTSLSRNEQLIHLFSLLLVTISGILVLAPAAYHREANHQISKHFIQLGSRFLAWAMVPLALGTCLDIYLVTRVILDSESVSAIITVGIGGIFAWTWFVMPRLRARRLGSLPIHDLKNEESKNP